MSETSIEWTDRTWNPVRGCSRVSEGCRHCYAERMASRFAGLGKTFHGFAKAGGTSGWTGRVELVPEKLDEPLRWRKPCRIFVNSMSDLFHEALPDEAIDRVFAVMVFAPRHTFQVLTKRPARMRDYFSGSNVWARIEAQARRLHRDTCTACQQADGACLSRPHLNGLTLADGPWPNVCLGVSVEDQKTADERVPLLLETPAAVRFVSYEPALGPVDLDGPDPYPERGWLRGWHVEEEHASGCDGSCFRCPEAVQVQNERLDWVIVGGESGPGARPFDVAWARSVVLQCREAGVACFVKQLGAKPIADEATNYGDWLCLNVKHPKGGDPAEWPEDLRVREYPTQERRS